VHTFSEVYERNKLLCSKQTEELIERKEMEGRERGVWRSVGRSYARWKWNLGREMGKEIEY